MCSEQSCYGLIALASVHSGGHQTETIELCTQSPGRQRGGMKQLFWKRGKEAVLGRGDLRSPLQRRR